MKVVIGIPCFEMCHSRFAQSLAAMERPCSMEFMFCIGNGCAESRDIISHYAMDNGADYVLFIDSDETFSPDVLSRLLKDQKDIISGMVMHRKPPYDPVLLNHGTKWETVTEIPDEPFRVDCSGGGACLLIRTSVLRKVFDTYKEIWFPYPHTTEDLSFALRCKDLGYEWWCDPGVQVGHIGSVEITPEMILREK